MGCDVDLTVSSAVFMGLLPFMHKCLSQYSTHGWSIVSLNCHPPETAFGFVCPLCWPGVYLASCPLLWHKGGELMAACIPPLALSTLLSNRRAEQVCLSDASKNQWVSKEGKNYIKAKKEGKQKVTQYSQSYWNLCHEGRLPRDEVEIVFLAFLPSCVRWPCT